VRAVAAVLYPIVVQLGLLIRSGSGILFQLNLLHRVYLAAFAAITCFTSKALSPGDADHRDLRARGPFLILMLLDRGTVNLPCSRDHQQVFRPSVTGENTPTTKTSRRMTTMTNPRPTRPCSRRGFFCRIRRGRRRNRAGPPARHRTKGNCDMAECKPIGPR